MRPSGAHQLQVVDDDQPEAVLRAGCAAGAPWRGLEHAEVATSRRSTAAPARAAATACEDLRPARSATRPLRRSSPLIDACEATKRWASSASDISSENSATGLVGVRARRSRRCWPPARDLPIDGRAARMIRLPGWKPPVISSRSSKPDGVPVSDVPSSESCCELVELVVQHLARSRGSPAGESSWATSRIALLGLLDELARRRLVAEHARLDLVGRVAAAAAAARSRARSARSWRSVADGRDGAGERVDRRPAPPTSSSSPALRAGGR